MISFNYVGLIILLATFLPIFFLAFFPPKNNVLKTTKHKQLEIIQFISRAGILFFGIINIEDFGYHFINNITEVIWVIYFFTFIVFNYLCYIRYFFKGRKKEDLFNSFFIPLPIYISETLLYLGSGIILLNYSVIFFSVIYMVVTIFLNFRKRNEV